MKTFQEFQEGVKTLLGLGALGYGAYNYFKNRGEQNQEQPNKKTNVNKNKKNTEFQTGVEALKKAKERGGILNKSTYDALNNPDF